MLNKLLQKSRNAKNENNSCSFTKPIQQSGLGNTKQSLDFQKDVQMNTTTQLPSQQCIPSSKQSQKFQMPQNIHHAQGSSVNTVSSSICSQNTSIQTLNSQQTSSRTSVSIITNNLHQNGNTSNMQMSNDKQRQSLQLGSNIKQQSNEIAQENCQINTPLPIKYKPFDSQNSSIQKISVNLSNMDEFKEPEQKRNQQAFMDSSKKDIEYQKTIVGLQKKISQLVQELEKQTTLSHQALEDNSLFRKKYQDLKDSSQKQNLLYQRSDSIASSTTQAQQDLLQSVQVLEIQEENKKLKQKYQHAVSEASQWREKYENLEKQYEYNEDRLKDQYSKEIQALNNEINKYKQQQFGTNKSKKAANIIKSNPNNLLKENTNNSNIAQTYSDDWHSNYMIMKNDKDKAEKMLKKRIESLEEQNTFLQNEVNQLHQKHGQSKEINTEPIILNKSEKSYNQDNQMQNRKSTNLQELNYYFSNNLH